ncbi:MAG: hypothetical protein ACI8Y7_000828 [Candidatus Woesearchaeota archaeon]|jgi:hypothetical protein
MKNYIGITGYKTPQEVDIASSLYQKHKLPDNLTAMIGILSSHDLVQSPTIESGRFPATNMIPAIARAAPSWTLPMIHYQAKSSQDMVTDLTTMLSGIYDSCKAVQLNMTWPDPSAVRKLKSTFPDLDIVLPVIPGSLRNLQPTQIADKMSEYAGSVSYFLYDPSEGAGLEFDVEKAITVMQAVQEKLPGVNIGAAGGLDQHNVFGKVTGIKKHIDDFFIDAEGRLMPNATLDMKLCEGYISEAIRGFKER